MTKTSQEINYQYFLEMDIGDYVGEWIAVCEDHIVAHRKDLHVVVAEAKKNSGGKRFLLARVPSREAMIF